MMLCLFCHGSGVIGQQLTANGVDDVDCPHCGGTGWVKEREPEYWGIEAYIGSYHRLGNFINRCWIEEWRQSRDHLDAWHEVTGTEYPNEPLDPDGGMALLENRREWRAVGEDRFSNVRWDLQEGD